MIGHEFRRHSHAEAHQRSRYPTFKRGPAKILKAAQTGLYFIKRKPLNRWQEVPAASFLQDPFQIKLIGQQQFVLCQPILIRGAQELRKRLA